MKEQGKAGNVVMDQEQGGESLTIGVVGLGLIGGSLAKTIKLNTNYTVLGYDSSPKVLEKAKLLGALDEALTQENLASCNYVLVALYPKDIVSFVEEHAQLFGEGTIVVDCGGVKRAVCDRLRQVARNQRWHFIGGHPMAGREYAGFRYAQDDLFERASMILTPFSETAWELMREVKGFFLRIGFQRVVFSTPEEHDEMIAYTSQMAHIISSAYVRSDLALKHKGFSAGSFQDMTRVARMNEGMWTELFLLNREPLVCELDGILERLQVYRDAIADADEQQLLALLREGRERKELLSLTE